MTICGVCSQDMLDGVGCSDPVIVGFADGITRERLRYGQESENWDATAGKRCGDCGCPPGTLHHMGCDLELCPLCKGQFITCDCFEDDEENGFDLDQAIAELSRMPVVDWRPLEEFFGSPAAPELSAFMYMDSHHLGVYGRVHEYKHVDTRRYLMISDTGHLFQWTDERGHFKISRERALACVYDGIDELYLSRPGSLPRREVFACERNRPDAVSEPEAS